jgi:Fis family transcriptional regulator
MSMQPSESSPLVIPRQERRKKPLSSAVTVALNIYFEQLGGQKPDKLYRLVMEEVERPLLECMMHYCRGNQSKAAEYLGLNRGTLRKKLKTHGLDRSPNATQPMKTD